MIRFRCHCQHGFEVENDLAGGTIQCPQCGRLKDVPTLGELANLDEDGTLKLADSAETDDLYRLARTVNAFRHARRDEFGEEIDLRTQPDDLVDDLPLGPALPGQAPKPRYDPETGELIRAPELKPQTHVAAGVEPDAGPIPMARLAPLTYAPSGLRHAWHSSSLLVALFLPANLPVIIAAFLIHVVGGMLYLVLLVVRMQLLKIAGIPLPIWVFNFAFWFAVAHYGATIEDLGSNEQDELHPPLRGLELMGDIIAPLLKVIAAVFLCYLPMFLAIALDISTTARLPFVPFIFIGGALFPAVALTLLTSGNVFNLRPDRVLAMTRESGRAYWTVTAIWIVLFPIFLLITLNEDVIGPFIGRDLSLPAGHAFVMLPLMFPATYFMHFFCWRLAGLYRLNHGRFPWIWEEHFAQRNSRPLAGPRRRAPSATPNPARAGVPLVGAPGKNPHN